MSALSLTARATALIVTTTGAVLASSCAAPRNAENPFPAAEAKATSYLLVANQSYSDIQVYLVQQGARISVGRVPASGTARLRLPTGPLNAGTVSLLAEERPRVKGADYRTDPISLVPGQRVRWRLEAVSGRSFVSLSRR